MAQLICEGERLQLFKRDTWEFAERKKGKSAVVIFSTTDQDELVLIEQMRLAVNARVVDFPAGLVGDEDDATAIETARKELREETGFECEQIEELGSATTSPGITSETVTICRASGLKRMGRGGGVGHEKIDVHLVPRADILEWLRKKQNEGCLIDMKVWAGLYILSAGK